MAIEPIKNADSIVLARILGWAAIVKRGEHHVGDKIIYCEIDSLLPERPDSSSYAAVASSLHKSMRRVMLPYPQVFAFGRLSRKIITHKRSGEQEGTARVSVAARYLYFLTEMFGAGGIPDDQILTSCGCRFSVHRQVWTTVYSPMF